ncbi:MBL fold metallo-hydrolase [Planococcus sp. APC 3900]|uniref:MBL fold metallo-hydrolase n=1 Tax=Planococcus sp. APC 3900 TaxID=3035191 RepID=UPI0025B3E687|nr:MBL fold metallo-hydrolase [Planococcus sp. APC 3900]MDN3437962.1 MBL fold metallo-hydrolase [Planococcus sp. APC 3900]
MFYLVMLIVGLGVGILVFTNIYPTFGSNPSKEQKEVYETFANYEEGKFINLPSEIVAAGSPITKQEPNSASDERSPTGQIPLSEIDWDQINAEEDSLTWLGHSAFILSLDNKKILIDPMLGPVASPVSFIGPKRYSDDLLDTIEEMPPIDAVFITHDHYDHLDYQSIKRLKSKVAHFFVPYGVGNHLVKWGVEEDKITELNWWDETEFQGLTIALAPAKHFSGRGILNQNSTLWGGWVIIGNKTRFYTSGDGGYDAHFKEIGNKYGPFDIALIEGGQYDSRWPDSHMQPEESVQASIDLKSENMMLMHWGAFTLARHSWSDPIERAVKEAEAKEVKLLTPKIGDTLQLKESLSLPVSGWWE